jgi:hypothetical protein
MGLLFFQKKLALGVDCWEDLNDQFWDIMEEIEDRYFDLLKMSE